MVEKTNEIEITNKHDIIYCKQNSCIYLLLEELYDL